MPILKRNPQDSNVPGAEPRPMLQQQNNFQPSSQAGNPAGNQRPKVPGVVPTGSAPGRLAVDAPGQQALLPSQRAAQIASEDSDLNRQAATRGRQFAQERGLLNSSIAAGAAQGAVLDRAADLATADASAALQSRQIDVDERIRTFQASLDSARFEADEAYRRDVLEQQKALDAERLGLERESLDLQAELGRGGLEIQQQRVALDAEFGRAELGLREKGLALQQTQFDFYSRLDMQKFQADDAYRRDALSMQRYLAERQADIAYKGLALDTARLKQQERSGLQSAIQTNANWYSDNLFRIHAEARDGNWDKETLDGALANLQAEYERKNAETADLWGIDAGELPDLDFEVNGRTGNGGGDDAGGGNGTQQRNGDGDDAGGGDGTQRRNTGGNDAGGDDAGGDGTQQRNAGGDDAGGDGAPTSPPAEVVPVPVPGQPGQYATYICTALHRRENKAETRRWMILAERFAKGYMARDEELRKERDEYYLVAPYVVKLMGDNEELWAKTAIYVERFAEHLDAGQNTEAYLHYQRMWRWIRSEVLK